MTISSCPKCDEKVTVPNNAPRSARVRCPLCQEEYVLSEVLDKLPPALVLLDVPDVVMDDSPTGFAEHGDYAGDYRVAPDDRDAAPAESEESSESPAFHFGGPSAGSATATAKPSFSATPRAKPRKKSPVVEIVKVVVGGVVGLFLAQMILWWIPISSLGVPQRDPLQLGQTIGKIKFISWIVPASVRGTPIDNSGGKVDTADSTQNWAGGAAPATAGANGKKSNPSKTKGNSQNTTATDLVGDPTTLVPPTTSFEDDPFGTGAIPNPLDTNPIAPPVTPKPPEPEIKPTDPEFVGVRNAPKVGTVDLEDAVGNARGALVTLDGSTGLSADERKKAALDFYEASAKLGEVLVYINQQDPNNSSYMEIVAAMFTEFSEQPTRIAQIEVLSDVWLKSETPANQGVLLVGTVKQVRAQGKVFETEVELSTKTPRTVSLITATDPTDFLLADTKILFAGSVLKEPSLNLGGYTGNASEVICGGYIVPLPPTEN
jgi:hypothetical protein